MPTETAVQRESTLSEANISKNPGCRGYNVRSLKSLALSGTFWTLGGYGVSQILRLGSHLILAWLLSPQIFGLMALIKIVQQGLNMFSDIGIAPSIIHSTRGDDPAFYNTAWTIQIVRGIVLWICACILAWPFAALFARNDPAAWQLRYLLPVAAFSAVFNGFNSTALATLNKHLHLAKITKLELFSQFVSLTVMVTWSLINPTVWAIVAGGLAMAFFKMIMSHFILPGHSVRLHINRECLNELYQFGKWIFLSTAFTFLAMNLDKLVLGNLLSLSQLGLYNMAFVFTKMGYVVCSKIGETVLYPIFSKLKNDPEKMLSIALRSRRLVLWVGSALCVCIAVGSPLFFETLWDARYYETGRIAQWMVVYIWTMILSLTIPRIILALGNSRTLFLTNVWGSLGVAIAVGGYMVVGLSGFILGLAVGTILVHLYLVSHLPAKRREIIKQGLQFSSAVLAYGIPAVAFTIWIRTIEEMWLWFLSVALLCAFPVFAALRVVIRDIRT